jgi:hypothetical protein
MTWRERYEFALKDYLISSEQLIKVLQEEPDRIPNTVLSSGLMLMAKGIELEFPE